MYSTLSSALGIFSVGDTKARGRIQEKCNGETGGIEFQMALNSKWSPDT